MGRTKTMQIALVRHGKPTVDPGRIPAHQLDSWMGAYNRAGIDPGVPPPARARELASTATYAVSSDLPRAVESLRTLGPGRVAEPERIYREAGLPALPSGPVRLDPQLWAVLARVGWFLGWSGDSESAARARRRARAASERLSEHAATHGSVLLLGHGIFNALIAAELRASGWSGPLWPNGTYWSAGVYRKKKG